MAFSKKTWKDRVTQYPSRRVLTDINTSQTQTVTVTRSEGTVTEAGDIFNATTMNDLENRINNGFNSVDTKYSGLPYCSVFYSNGGSNATFSSSPVIFNNVVTDTHNAYSTSTGKFTCPIDGIYIITVNYYSGSYSSSTARPRIWHEDSNGTLYADGGVQLLGQNCVSVCSIFSCVQGDVLYFGPQSGSSSYALSIYGASQHNAMNIACLRPL